MKKLLSLGVLFVVFLHLGIFVGLSGCGRSGGKLGVIKTDTGIVNYFEGSYVRVAFGKWEIIRHRKFEDSSSTKGVVLLDTVLIALRLEDITDTIKIKGKPVYDSFVGRYEFGQKWRTFNADQRRLIHYSLTSFRSNPSE